MKSRATNSCVAGYICFCFVAHASMSSLHICSIFLMWWWHIIAVLTTVSLVAEAWRQTSSNRGSTTTCKEIQVWHRGLIFCWEEKKGKSHRVWTQTLWVMVNHCWNYARARQRGEHVLFHAIYLSSHVQQKINLNQKFGSCLFRSIFCATKSCRHKILTTVQ